MRHGKAVIPFGKYKGTRIRLLPDDYLSWLSTLPMMREWKWRWLWDSLISELKFRGFRYDLADTEDPVVPLESPELPKRKFRFVKEGVEGKVVEPPARHAGELADASSVGPAKL